MSTVQTHVSIDGATHYAGDLHASMRRGRVASTFAFAPAYLTATGAYCPEPSWSLTTGSWSADGALPRRLEARDGDRGDYLDIAERIGDISADPSTDLQELWQRILLTLLINNTDDHLRNHGFLRVAGGWRLAPLFDINPNPDPTAHRMTSLGGHTSLEPSLAALIERAPHFALSPENMAERLEAVAGALSRWRSVAQTNGAPARDLDRFADVFELGLQLLKAQF